MKKTIFLSAVILVMFLSIPFHSSANDIRGTPKSKTEIAIEVKILTNRLDEIHALDKSTMNAKEKRVLRHEVKKINRNLNTLGGGVYLSVGSIIVILLLLILLL